MGAAFERQDQEPQPEERRTTAGRRVAWGGVVSVGGALGPSFEAQALDVSREGMHLRTAYLPEVGQPLTCRFDAAGREVLASGEVVWRHEEGRGGEFAIRFAELDAESAEALAQIVDPGHMAIPREPGAKVRLHIEGLGSPMRARVKDVGASALTVGSDLGFLQVGKELELEDAATGGKRPARIDRVEVEVDKESRIPQLVVTLRYDDEPEVADGPAIAAPVAKGDGTPEPSVIDDERAPKASAGEDTEPTEDGLPLSMKSAFARSAAKVTPALGKLMKRTVVMAGLLAARARKEAAAAPPPRRTTAPPPGGALHATGRRVVRSEPVLELVDETASGWRSKRSMALAAAGILAALLLVLAFRKPSAPQAQAGLPTQTEAAPSSTAPPSIPAVTAAASEPAFAAQPSLPGPMPDRDLPGATAAGEPEHGHGKLHVTPFGSGPVGHGNTLHIKMDGAIEKIEGASTPTGFTVVIPNRRSLEAAAPLAARDNRIASMRVTNEGHGAELNVAFKDGVPNYLVRAKGDTLEVVLATPGRVIESETPHPLLKPLAKSHHPKH